MAIGDSITVGYGDDLHTDDAYLYHQGEFFDTITGQCDPHSLHRNRRVKEHFWFDIRSGGSSFREAGSAEVLELLLIF